MAVYQKIGAGNILNGAATIQPPPGGAAAGQTLVLVERAQQFANIDGQTAAINGRYKVGGTDGWERPGSNLP